MLSTITTASTIVFVAALAFVALNVVAAAADKHLRRLRTRGRSGRVADGRKDR